MSSRSPRSLLLAILAAVAMVLSPLAATGAAAPVPPTQDPGEQPGDLGGDEPFSAELQEEGDFTGVDDPGVWEQLLTEFFFSSVTCTADDTGYDSFTVAQPAPDGTEWVVAVLLTDTSAVDGLFMEYGSPAVGDELLLYADGFGDDPSTTVPIDSVILCSGVSPYGDPAFYEDLFSQDGSFTGVTCAADDTGYDSYTISEPAPEGKEWLVVALLGADGDLTEVGMPRVGRELFLIDESDPSGEATLPIARVILCSADADSMGFVDPYDPETWAGWITADGFEDVSCTTDDTGYDAYTITDPAPAGTEWLMLVLLPDFEADNGRYDGWYWEEFLPESGEAYALPDPEDESFEATLPIDRVILCSGSLGDNGGGDDGGDDDGGGEPIGPPIETDVPAPADGSGAGPFAALAAAAALVIGAVVLSLRRSVARR